MGSASVSWATWERVTVGDGYLDVEMNYSENTGSSRSTTLIFTQNGSDNKIHLTVTQEPFRSIAHITISVSKSPTSNTTGNCNIDSDKLVASDIIFRLQIIQWGVSSGDVKEYIYTLVKGSAISRNNFAIQDGANPKIVDCDYSPQEDSKYIYSVTTIL